jgi:hypothetical protein
MKKKLWYLLLAAPPLSGLCLTILMLGLGIDYAFIDALWFCAFCGAATCAASIWLSIRAPSRLMGWVLILNCAWVIAAAILYAAAMRMMSDFPAQG